MSSVAADPLNLPVDRAEINAGTVRRTAFYRQSRGEAIFTWLHHPDHGVLPGHGVVICPPIGYEQIHAHRGLRHLADALAQTGFPVLRFDYHGTGDSAGVDEDADRHETWLTNIRDAIAWMQNHLGCTQISLVGLRLGAALAVQVAQEQAVENLVLWAPVVKGRLYVREMKALALTATTKPQPLPEAPDDIEAAGFVLTKQTADALSRIDLLTSRPRCQHALIVTRDDLPADTRLLDHWSALGIDARQTALPGYADMMAEPHFTKVPRLAIGQIVDWLSAQPPPPAESSRQLTVIDAAPAEAWISGGHIHERAFQISDQPDLFGVISEPGNLTVEELPLVVLLNAGSAYHVGPSRLYTLLARRLAADGFRCLRLDMCGLGDSVTTDADKENETYAATAFRDVELTLKACQARLGANRVVLMGLCSGAYVAFQSAAQLANPVIVESVLINPLTFYWKDGMTLETAPAVAHGKFHYYWNAALQPRKWLKLLTGRTQLGILGAARMLIERLRQAAGAAVLAAPIPTNAEPGHPAVEDLPADLDRVAKAGRRLSCFFADSDPGYSILMFHARRKVNELRHAGLLDVTFIPDSDHTFSERVPRRAFLQAIAAHLANRYR